MDEIVDNVLHPDAVLLSALLSREGRHERGLMIIDDEENVAEAKKAGVVIRSEFSTDEAPKAGVKKLSWRTAKKIFGTDRASRYLAVAEIPAPLSADDVLKRPGDVVLLEDLAISGNIGAIIRTSLGLGAAGLIAVSGDIDLSDRRLVRASRGYLFHLPVAAVPLPDALQAIRRSGKTLVLASAHGGETPATLAELPGDAVLAFGSEKDGSSLALEAAALKRVNIPMPGPVESLNVSVSAAILLYGRLSRSTASGSLKE